MIYKMKIMILKFFDEKNIQEIESEEEIKENEEKKMKNRLYIFLYKFR